MHTSRGDPYELATRKLRQQRRAFSVDVLEAARAHRAASEGTRQLDQQTYQCQAIGKLEGMLREDADSGTFRAAGGHESGLYETFFRICPGRFMTKSQFIYVRPIVAPCP